MDSQCYECGFGKAIQNNFCVGSLNCNATNNVCESCAPGFTLKSDGNCHDASEGCERVGDNFGTCAKCKDGFKMIGYRCVREDVFVPNCYIYYNETSCEICKNGFSFFQNYCLLPIHIQGILNGSTTIEATVIQIRAESGVPTRTNTTSTTTSTTTTTVIITNPTTNTNTNANTNTNTNTNTNSNANSNANANTNANTNTNTNTVRPSDTPIPNCANQNSGLCLGCNSGFVLSNNTCQQMDQNCGSYELTTGRCISCIPNFQFGPVGLCIPVPAAPRIANC